MVVIKMLRYRSAERLLQLQEEYNFMKLLHGTGITPPVLECDSATGALVMEDTGGTSFCLHLQIKSSTNSNL